MISYLNSACELYLSHFLTMHLGEPLLTKGHWYFAAFLLTYTLNFHA